MRYFCTYFDRNYLAKGLSLIESLRLCHEEEITIYVVCMDELTRLILEKLSIPQLILIPLHTVEAGDEQLLATRGNRTPVEYLWTSTPTIILRLLERHPEIDVLTYVDADMFCYGSTEPVIEELGKGSVLIHEHRFTADLAHLERFGRFNVGLLVFRRDEISFEVLRWWRDRCIEWCKATLEDGKYGDQKYLDAWPTMFPGVVVTKNVGVGTAPWNHAQYHFSSRGDCLYVNNVPLVINHFHAFYVINTDIIVPVAIPDYGNPASYFMTAVPRYISALENSIRRIREVCPEFNFGLTKDNFQFTPHTAFLVRTSELPRIRAIAPSLSYAPVSPNWTLSPGTRVFMDIDKPDNSGAQI